MLKKGILWDFIGMVFNQGITFVISIFLARLLLPKDFAIVAMAMAFFGISRVFIDVGLSQALIQKKDVKNIHYNSIFWLNLILSLIIGVLFFLSAPFIADFYQQTILINIIRVLSTVFFINALSQIHITMLKKAMDFKYLSTTNVISAVMSGIIGVSFALTGFGVWSIIIQYITAAVIKLFLLWYGNRWIPQFEFSWGTVKPLWNYGKKLFFSALLENIAVQADVFVIGKLFPAATLGFYSRGKSLNQLIASYSSGSIGRVLFPALSNIQEDKLEIKKKVVDFFRLAAILSFYLGGVLYITAEDIIVIMFTEKWLPTVPYFRIMVLSCYAYPISIILLTPIQSLGRSDIFFNLELAKKTILVFIYVIGFQFGIYGFLYASFISRFIGISLNGYYSGKLINWSLGKQWIEIFKYGIPAYVGAGILFIFLPNTLIPNHFTHLLLTGLIFTLYYASFNLIFKTKAAQIIINLAKPFIIKTLKLKR